MDFVEVLKRINHDLYDQADKAALPKLGRFLDRSKGMAPLLKSGNPILDPFLNSDILALSGVYQNFLEWKDAYRNTKRILATSEYKIPDQSLHKAVFDHEMQTLLRASTMCQRSGYPDLDSWTKAIDAHVDLWNESIDITLKSGTVSTSFTGDEKEELKALILSGQQIDKIDSQTWLSVLKSVEAGVLTFEITLPVELIVKKTKESLKLLGTAAEKRDPQDIADELILGDLKAVIESSLLSRSTTEVVQTVQAAFKNLISVPPLDCKTVLSVFVGGSDDSVGIVASEKRGKIIETLEVEKDKNLLNALIAYTAKFENCGFVAPVAAEDEERLNIVDEFITSKELPAERILTTALDTATKTLKTPPSIASATVLLMRAIRPAGEWSKIPVEQLDLGTSIENIDQAKIDSAIEEARLLQMLEQKKGALANQGKSAKKMKRLNAMVRTIRDLKAGMTVDGIVTNLTKFGAFVNVGLTTEAMIHVSQLSTDFIDQPSQVVKVGQTINARILEVIPERGRIALSLKPENSDAPGRTAQESKELQNANSAAESLFTAPEKQKEEEVKPQGERLPTNETAGKFNKSSGAKDNMKQEAPKKSRSEALADLDALFK